MFDTAAAVNVVGRRRAQPACPRVRRVRPSRQPGRPGTPPRHSSGLFGHLQLLGGVRRPACGRVSRRGTVRPGLRRPTPAGISVRDGGRHRTGICPYPGHQPRLGLKFRVIRSDLLGDGCGLWVGLVTIEEVLIVSFSKINDYLIVNFDYNIIQHKPTANALISFLVVDSMSKTADHCDCNATIDFLPVLDTNKGIYVLWIQIIIR